MRLAFRRGVALGVVAGALGAMACGDVRSELIMGAGGTSAGSGGTGAGSSGAGAGSANEGGTSAGSSSGGASGGTGSTPECTPETVDADCGNDSDRVFCHPDSLECVECVYEAHCDAEENCSEALGECAVPCTSSTDCTDDDERFCDTSIGFCVECLADTDCSSGRCSNWSCD